jgi:hypothetical protein
MENLFGSANSFSVYVYLKLGVWVKVKKTLDAIFGEVYVLGVLNN